MTNVEPARVMDDIQINFNLQMQALRADMSAMRAGQDALGARVEAVNTRFQVSDGRQLEILEQVKLTNGRVGELENWQHFEQGKAAGSGSTGRVLVAVAGVTGTLVGGAVGILGLVLRG